MYKTTITHKEVEARDAHRGFGKLEKKAQKNEIVIKVLFKLILWVWGIGLLFCGWSSSQPFKKERKEGKYEKRKAAKKVNERKIKVK